MFHWDFCGLLFFTFTLFRCYDARFVVVAPNLIRTDTEENVFIQADSEVQVTIRFKDYISENDLTTSTVPLNNQNKFHALAPVKLPSDYFKRDEKVKQYVYLEVQFGNAHTEKRALLVSFQSGYIFIQTDKPIYKPGQDVQIRMYATSPSFKGSDTKPVSIDIKNPADVVVDQKSSRKPTSFGIVTVSYTIPKIASEGKWTIHARFDRWPENNFNTTFDVKNYGDYSESGTSCWFDTITKVLPDFNVTAKPRKLYMNVEDTVLFVDITASYFFGESVIGTAYVVYGVKKDKRIKRAPKVKKVTMSEDGGTLNITMKEIQEACAVQIDSGTPNCSVHSLVDSYVYIKVSVLTQSGGDLVEIERSDIKIVNSPFVLKVKNMQQYLKPSWPFHVTILVNYHEGTPAQNVPLTIEMESVPALTVMGNTDVSINMLPQIKAQTFTIKTAMPDLKAEKQAQMEVTVKPYIPKSQQTPNYLYIRVVGNVQLGAVTLELSVTSGISRRIREITYLVLSKGKLLAAKRVSVDKQQLTSVIIDVTSEMIPTFRFVAFYILDGEVVSDSVKLEVSNTCFKPPSVSTSQREFNPGKMLKLKVQGEPSAVVSLVAVNQAVYALSKRRFNQRHILDEVDSRDMGCTHGSGENAMGVFRDAGLLFATNDGSSTDARQYARLYELREAERPAHVLIPCECTARSQTSSVLITTYQGSTDFDCPNSVRRRRSPEILQQFETKQLSHCCRDGLRGVRMPYSCEQRALYITEGHHCVNAFLKCCIFQRNQISPRERGLGRNSGPGATSDVTNREDNDALRGEDGFYYDEEDVDLNDIQLRHKFQDTWLWRDVDLPADFDLDGTATAQLDPEALPDTITQWSILAVSSSKKTGVCVAEPWTFDVKTKFFVDLKLPFSVARNEQVEIKAVVYNFMDEDMDVTVVLDKTIDICSRAFNKQYSKKVTVISMGSTVVPYTIVPLVSGDLPIVVSAFVMNLGRDRVQKMLNVVVEGVQKTEKISIPLNPAGGKQVVKTSKPELKGVVLKSQPVTKIKLTGSVLSETIENAIHDDPLNSLIKMPGGCVEQNLATVTFPLISSLYLDQTNGWESVGVQRKADADRFIMSGYGNQLVFRRADGSYPPHANEGASIWVTAYVLKIFTMAFSMFSNRGRHTDHINLNEICQSLKFLVKHQSPDGSFTDANPLCHADMAGGVQGPDSQATLSAFVAIALAEVKEANLDCDYKGIITQQAYDRIFPYLKWVKSTRPYTTAIVSYALALLPGATHDPIDSLLAASSDGTFWPDKTAKMEATGYALLALVKMGRLAEAKKPFEYLRDNRDISGSYGNTQSTMVVLQALAAYLVAQPPPVDHFLKVSVQILDAQKSRSESLSFNSQSSYQMRSFDLSLNGDFVVEAEGNGEGTLEVVAFYNQIPEEDTKSCKAFDFQVTIEKAEVLAYMLPPGVISVFDFSIQLKALGADSARSVILDITLPTGFTAQQSDLTNLLNSVEKHISLFYFDDKLSDRNSLIIHMYKVSNTTSQMVTFRLLQQFNVGLSQPSFVTVYEYYKEGGQRCTRRYSLPDQVKLTTICNQGECVCTVGDCFFIRTDSQVTGDKPRETYACSTLHHVFKVKVRNITRDLQFRYEMEITRVFKLGTEAGVMDGEVRYFVTDPVCGDTVVLQKDSEYLIMGPERDKWNADPATNKIMYLLTKDTWVERWPTAAECAQPEFQATCRGLTTATEFLYSDGCRL